jgi:hypothetical protein
MRTQEEEQEKAIEDQTKKARETEAQALGVPVSPLPYVLSLSFPPPRLLVAIILSIHFCPVSISEDDVEKVTATLSRLVSEGSPVADEMEKLKELKHKSG